MLQANCTEYIANQGFNHYNGSLTTRRAGNNRPFFLAEQIAQLEAATPVVWWLSGFFNFEIGNWSTVALQQIVEQTVTGLGYDLVEIERSAGGLLRITIDWPWSPPPEGSAPQEEQFLTVEDCEKVTRQLQFALEVDAVDYKRLEVSSPGIDRLLRHEIDFVRFCGQIIDITLKEPMGAAAAGQVSPLRKKFRGQLARAEGVAGWQIAWSDEPAVKPGQRVSKKRLPAPLQVLGFTLDELREARLAPIVNFKGRAAKLQGAGTA